MSFSLLLLLVLAGLPGALEAQEAQSPSGNPIYLTVGVGTGTMNLAGHLGMTMHLPVGEVTLRAAGVNDFRILGPSSNANDVALLYGARRVEGNYWFGVTAGPSVAWMTTEQCEGSPGGWFGCGGRRVVEREWRPGLAFQSTAGWRHVSISALGDLNGAQSFAAGTLNFHVGRVR